MSNRKKLKAAASHSMTDIQPFITLPELDLFTRDRVQVSVQSFIEEEILPTGNWNNGSEISFNVRGDPETFLDPNSLRLRITAKILKNDGVSCTKIVIIVLDAVILDLIFLDCHR